MCVYTSLEQTLIIAHKEEIHPSTTECSSPCYFTTARRHYSQSLRSIVPLCRYLMHFKSRVLHFDMMKYTTNFAMNARRLGNVILFIFHLFLYTCILYLSFIMCADGNRCMQNNNNNTSSSRIYAWFNESSKWWNGGPNVRLCTHRAITVSELRGADIFLFDSLAGWTIQGIRIYQHLCGSNVTMRQRKFTHRLKSFLKRCQRCSHLSMIIFALFASIVCLSHTHSLLLLCFKGQINLLLQQLNANARANCNFHECWL